MKIPMHVYFSVDQRHHGVGPVKYAWDPAGNFLASTGSSRVVHIFDRRGELVDQIVPPSPSMCTHLEWSTPCKENKNHGIILAVTQANSSMIVLWYSGTQTTQNVDINVKEITLLRWNKGKATTIEENEDHSILLAIGTSKGQVVFYQPYSTERPIHAMHKHKKKILCGDWNTQNEFAYGSEDRQITICWKDGRIIDQVKIKASPISIQFGGRESNHIKRIVSVNMGRETILLYDLNEKENALELAFQSRYGDIIDYRWFGNGYIIAGFSLGYVVIISTHLNEIGQEQYCAKFHENHLYSICYNEINGMVATCGDTSLKIVRMMDWKEIAVEELNHELFDDLNWTLDGRILSVSCKNGFLHHFKLFQLEQTCIDYDINLKNGSNLIVSILIPFTPPILLFTIGSMIGLTIFLVSYTLNVSLYQLIMAISGHSIRL